MAFRDAAPSFVKRWVWNRKFRESSIQRHWAPPPAFVAAVYARAGPAGAVLDMGCGAADVRTELVRLGWHGDYVGVDISPAAIELARQQADSHAQWTVSAIENYKFPRLFDAVCFLESIYYVRPAKISGIIQECVDHLTPQGGIFIKICDRSRHAETIRQIELLKCDRLRLFVSD
jgi:SAM-dependent methyltransferase